MASIACFMLLFILCFQFLIPPFFPSILYPSLKSLTVDPPEWACGEVTAFSPQCLGQNVGQNSKVWKSNVFGNKWWQDGSGDQHFLLNVKLRSNFFTSACY
jgi:hypothetical protein